MEKEIKYEEITIQEIEENENLYFVCDGDNKIVKVIKEEE